MSYLLSFLLVGLQWMWHHRIFHYIRRYDFPLLWINTLYLMFVALVPFPAALLGHYATSQVAMIVYTATLAACSLVGGLLWVYASHGHRLIAEDVDRAVVRRLTLRGLTPPVILTMAMLFTIVDRSYTMFGIILGLLAMRLTTHVAMKRV